MLKCSATNQALLLHTGPAAVFESPDDLAARIDDPALGLTPAHIVVVRYAGPIAAGMPEAGSAPIPRYLAQTGVTDMVRVSDARMSGTASGTVVLHISPEAAAGGPLALVRDGDLITLDVAAGRLDLLVDDDVLAARKQDWEPLPPPERGWRRLHHLHVGSATEGADFDFC